MKTCPKCKEPCQDDWNCCPNCGTVFPDADNYSAASASERSTFTGGIHSSSTITKTNSDNKTNSTDTPITENRSFASAGEGSTFTGGINSTSTTTKVNSDNKTNSDNKINSENTTINNYEAPKSSAQLLTENELKYRNACQKLYNNGFISKEGEEELRELQVALGLADKLVLPIKKEIQEQSRKKNEQLSGEVLNGIRQTKTKIEQNSPYTLNRQLQELDSWMKEYEDDALKAYFFQLFSMLEPTRYTERYEQSSKEEYWEVYWAYIAYLLQNKNKQAYDAQASLGRLQFEYPEQNEILLRLAGRLMQNDPIDDIKQEYNVQALLCSPELLLLRDTVDELLNKDWSAEPPIKIREVHLFYANTLFKSFVETQKALGEKKRIEMIRISRAEQERQNEINRQKNYLLRKFGEVENIEKACQVLGISDLTLQDWLKDDSSFKLSYNDIVRRIENKRAEEDKKARIAQELEERTKQQKSQFKPKYEQNGCDFIKTCSDLNIDSDTVRMWRRTDKAFDDGLTVIERENEKKLQELFVQFYESNGCDLQKACAEAGVSEDKVNSWRESYKEFDGILYTIENEHVQAIKEAFIKCYKNNNCDLGKTCRELELNSEITNKWCTNDPIFNNAIVSIEDEYKRWLKKKKVIIRKKKWEKMRPYVLCGILIIVGILGIIYLKHKERIETQTEQEDEARRVFTISYYNETVDHLKDFMSSIPDDDKKVSIEKDVTILDSCYTILCKVFNLEKDPILADIQQESVDLKEKMINKTYGLFEYAKDLGSAPDTIPNYKQLHQMGQKYMSTIDSLKQLITTLK